MSRDQVNYSKVTNGSSSDRRVDINDLLSRARDDVKKHIEQQCRLLTSKD